MRRDILCLGIQTCVLHAGHQTLSGRISGLCLTASSSYCLNGLNPYSPRYCAKLLCLCTISLLLACTSFFALLSFQLMLSRICFAIICTRLHLLCTSNRCWHSQVLVDNVELPWIIRNLCLRAYQLLSSSSTTLAFINSGAGSGTFPSAGSQQVVRPRYTRSILLYVSVRMSN